MKKERIERLWHNHHAVDEDGYEYMCAERFKLAIEQALREYNEEIADWLEDTVDGNNPDDLPRLEIANELRRRKVCDD